MKNPLFVEMNKTWFEFYEDQVGVGYSYTPKDGYHLKLLIKHIKNSLKSRNIPESDDKVVEAFSAILHNLPQWHLRNLSIPNINSKYNEIVSNIRQRNVSADLEQQLLRDLQAG